MNQSTQPQPDYVSELIQGYLTDSGLGIDAVRAVLQAEGDAAGRKLLGSLSHPSLPVRLIALKFLAEFGAAEDVAPLLNRLDRIRPDRQGEPSGWRYRLGLLLSPWLRETRREIDAISVKLQRRNVAYALSRMPSTASALDALRNLANDPDEHTRTFATVALARLNEG